MARCATLYQCFDFLARHDGIICLTKHPDNPCKHRCTIQIGDDIVSIEYDCTGEKDLVSLFLSPICKVLQDHMEKKNE